MEELFAPIALFAYKRPEHLYRTLESLKANPEAARSRLYVSCDGPGEEGDRAGVAEVRARVARLTGFASISVTLEDRNRGLAASIIQGVSRVLEEHDRVIVIEDDLLLSPHFLRYMNDALACYAGDAQVASVHGYVYPVAETLPETFFLQGADCWGWATWRRAWRHFNADGAELLWRLRESGRVREFDMDGSYAFTRMLEDQVKGKNESWAIRWHASCFLREMLTLYPGRTLVENIGNDASGTHCGASDAFSSPISERPVRVSRIPLQVSHDARRAFVKFHRSQQAKSVFARGGRWLVRALGGRG